MTTTTTVETLLAPLAAPTRAGESLRFDPIYDQIKHHREEDDPTLPQGVWQRELKRADWSAVARLCTEALQTRTKDLQLAAWLTEAWVYLEGFAGLDRGLRLCAGLCREYWEELHPLIEEGSSDARLSPVVWIANKLLLPVKTVPVTAPAGEDAEAYGWKDWESGLYLIKLTRAAAATSSGMVSQQKFLVSVSLTPGAWFATLGAQVASALAAVDELDAVLTEKCGVAAAPSLTQLRETLDAIHAFAARTVAERVKSGEIPLERGSEAAASSDIGSPAAAFQTVSSRAEAYQKLREAADYLLRTEPHSPVPYLVRRAVSWGEMSLSELLEELLERNADLPTVYTLLGIKRS